MAWDDRMIDTGWPVVLTGILVSARENALLSWTWADGSGGTVALTDPDVHAWVRRTLARAPRVVWLDGVCIINYGPPATAILTDSAEYEILARAAALVAAEQIPGLTAEIGVNRGGGTKVIIDALLGAGDKHRHHVCIDPYGDLPFAWHGQMIHTGYTDNVRDNNLANLYNYARDLPINLHFQVMTDTDFFSYFAAGYPIYEACEKHLYTSYALVHIDGQHSVESVMVATQFFDGRVSPGGVIVYDDCYDYDHSVIDGWLLAAGWSVLERGEKAKIAYRKPL